jgi:hypothetical protein
MNDRFEEEAAVATDAYIDWLLDARKSGPRAVDDAPSGDQAVQRTINLLYSRLPRFHPSFAFEEQLAARLRAAGETNPAGQGARIIRFTIDPPAATAVAERRLDPRVLLGVSGAAIASGVSVAAVYAWRHTVRRPRRHTGVPA